MSVAFTCDKCGQPIGASAPSAGASLTMEENHTIVLCGASVHEAKHFCESCRLHLIRSFDAWRRQEKLL